MTSPCGSFHHGRRHSERECEAGYRAGSEGGTQLLQRPDEQIVLDGFWSERSCQVCFFSIGVCKERTTGHVQNSGGSNGLQKERTSYETL